MKRFQSRAVDGTNKLISGATISVFLTGTATFAPLFSGEGLSALTNPFASDHLGVFEFYAESKDYDVDVKDPLTGVSRKYSDISHFDVRDVGVLKSGDVMVGRLRIKVDGVDRALFSNSAHLAAPAGAQTPDFNSGLTFGLDETGNKLWFYVKESGGSLLSGSLALV